MTTGFLPGLSPPPLNHTTSFRLHTSQTNQSTDYFFPLFLLLSLFRLNLMVVVRSGGPSRTAGWPSVTTSSAPSPSVFASSIWPSSRWMRTGKWSQTRGEIVQEMSALANNLFGSVASRRSLSSSLFRYSKEPTCSIGHRRQDPALLETLDARLNSHQALVLRHASPHPVCSTSLSSVSPKERKRIADQYIHRSKI